MTPREVEEYRALRATIRERGTTRVWIALAGISAWAALTVATAAIAAFPVATLLPLLVLATAFEIVLALHVGVERIGRYLQVFYEDTPGWETRIIRFGEAFIPGEAIRCWPSTSGWRRCSIWWRSPWPSRCRSNGA